jgi:FkbM family methyltransferase
MTSEELNEVRKYADFRVEKIYRGKVPPHLEKFLVQSFFDSDFGVFVDVGANDPVIDSQSYHLEQKGWNGLLIEPLPLCCEKLRQNRKAKVIQVACSSIENHNKLLPLTVSGVYSTLESKTIVPAKNSELINVLTQTLDSVLSENNITPGFELLSIDVEGHEIELFKCFNLQHWKPKLILLEDHVINHLKHNYMLLNGYQFLLRTGLNSWYVENKSKYDFSITARLEFFRKGGFNEQVQIMRRDAF